MTQLNFIPNVHFFSNNPFDFYKCQDFYISVGYGISGCSRRVQPDSVFRIASISKPVTAAIVMHVCGTANVSLEKQVFGKQGQ